MLNDKQKHFIAFKEENQFQKAYRHANVINYNWEECEIKKNLPVQVITTSVL